MIGSFASSYWAQNLFGLHESVRQSMTADVLHQKRDSWRPQSHMAGL